MNVMECTRNNGVIHYIQVKSSMRSPRLLLGPDARSGVSVRYGQGILKSHALTKKYSTASPRLRQGLVSRGSGTPRVYYSKAAFGLHKLALRDAQVQERCSRGSSRDAKGRAQTNSSFTMYELMSSCNTIMQPIITHDVAVFNVMGLHWPGLRHQALQHLVFLSLKVRLPDIRLCFNLPIS